MDKLKLAQLGERLKTSGAQMGRIVSGKMKEMKEILQTPTPESKMVDEATLETLEEPNWGLNLRICAMINSEEFRGSEIVRAIKRKISGKSVASQRLSLDLLEACTMNCEKVFSEVASEKLLEEMVRMIDSSQTDQGNRVRALQLIQAWGESEDLAYLPVFRQTYASLKGRDAPSLDQYGGSPEQNSLESYLHQQPQSPPASYPVPNSRPYDSDIDAFPLNYRILSIEEKKEYLAVARNSLELLSGILNAETEPKPLKDDLTVSMVEKCKESQPVIKLIVESTIDDEEMLFDALCIHDELQQVISKFEGLVASENSGDHQGNSETKESEAAPALGRDLPESLKATTKHEGEAAQNEKIDGSQANSCTLEGSGESTRLEDCPQAESSDTAGEKNDQGAPGKL